MSEGLHEGHAPTEGELRAMSAEQQMIAGADAIGVHIVERRERFPVRGTQAEKRAERAVASLFALAAAGGVAFIVVFVAMPYRWHMPGTPQTFRLYNPLLGITLGVMALGIGCGMVLWAKWLMPHELVVQDRHETPSSEQDKLMTAGTFTAALDDSGLPRRSLLLRTLGLAGGALAAVPLVILIGGMVKNPGDQLLVTLFARNRNLFPDTDGRVPIVYDDWRRAGPNDLEPGGIATVFPGVRQEFDGVDGVTSASSPTLLIRLWPGQTIQARKGQAHFGWPHDKPEYVAFSKICTHAGCPASLFEHQTMRILCPCHQSQFQVLEDAKPIFGPATRSLPQLPIDVVTGDDGAQYFVADSDYVEAIGPAFWNRK